MGEQLSLSLWFLSCLHSNSFLSVVVITCALHAQGRRFEPGRKQDFCCCLCSFPLQFIWCEFYDVVRWRILTNRQTNMSDVVERLGYLAFTQEARVRLPASEMIFNFTTVSLFCNK